MHHDMKLRVSVAGYVHDVSDDSNDEKNWKPNAKSPQMEKQKTAKHSLSLAKQFYRDFSEKSRKIGTLIEKTIFPFEIRPKNK